MTQQESGVFTFVDTSGYNPTATAGGGEIALIGHAVLKLDPTHTYTVQSAILTEPPTLTALDDGKSYIVASVATGDWATHEDDVAEWVWDFNAGGGTWTYDTPTSGDTAWDISTLSVMEFIAAWAAHSDPDNRYYWTATRKGKILTITNNSFGTFKNTYVDIDTVTWADAEADTTDVDSGTASYDYSNSLLRALELIFLGNGNAIVRVAILDEDADSDAETKPDVGITSALNEFLKYDNVSFINVAGKIPLSTIQTHVALASGDTYMSERVYVAGFDMANIYTTDESIDIPDGLTDMATVNANGRTIVFAINSNYTFSNVGDSTERTIGGNWLAHYFTGFFSSLPSNVPILRQGYQFSTVCDWDGNSGYMMSEPDRKFLANAFVNYIREQNGIKFYEIGRTFSNESTPYLKVTTRRIIDEVIKNVRLNLQSYLGRPINNFVMDTAETKIDTILKRLVRKGRISDAYTVSVYTTPSDAIDGKIFCDLRIEPATYISYIDLTISPV